MNFLVCVVFLAVGTVALGQDAEVEELDCDSNFIQAYHNANEKCFGKPNETVAEALSQAPAAIRAILRKKRSDEKPGCKKEWLDDPKKLAQMNKHIICMEDELAHTTFFQNMRDYCDKKVAEKNVKEEDERHAKVTCMGDLMLHHCKGKLGHYESKGGNSTAPQ